MKKLSDKQGNLTVAGVGRMFANPFYAVNIDPSLCAEHETLISEELWIKAGVNCINESGAENFLRDLLENLKGNYV